MPKPQEADTTDARLAEDDAGLLAAAIALCWAGRIPGYDEQQTPQWLWDRLNEAEQRLYLYRACVAVEAWENFWKGQGR